MAFVGKASSPSDNSVPLGCQSPKTLEFQGHSRMGVCNSYLRFVTLRIFFGYSEAPVNRFGTEINSGSRKAKWARKEAERQAPRKGSRSECRLRGAALHGGRVPSPR